MGVNATSSFDTAFKKETQLTSLQYRQQRLSKQALPQSDQ
jgi:AraC-like DNA-binding protein